jgi:LCP family protein required for cell wall assembly
MQITRIQGSYNRLRRRFFSNVYFARFFVIISVVLIALLTWVVVNKPISSGLRLVTGSPLLQVSGRTNILILGTGGSGHEGPDLADTIIVASVKLDTGETTLISIPRDLWVPSIRAKINTAYHYGFEKQGTGGGLLLAKSAVSESLNLPVHYVAKIDFSGFTKAIDILGGLDITIDRSFTDEKYPIPGKENDLCDGDPDYKCRYETLNFSAGPVHLDGQSALKFVRSRHSSDPQEGTDFARSKRQEKVITAVKNKIFSIKNLKDTQVYKDLFSLVQQSVVTDITSEYFSTFFQLSLRAKNHPLKSMSIESLLENPPVSSRFDLQWVLIPKGNNYQTLFASVAAELK